MARAGRRTAETPQVRAGGAGLPLFRRRARLYVDGFNLHHAILDLGRPELLWLDLKTLGRGLLPRRERLVGVTWVAAHRPQREDRMSAMATYELALRASGVRCLLGHFVVHGDHCRACGHSWMQATEKQSDVNLALAVAADAAADRFDVAYLLTTDGDHAATARFLQESYPRKRLVPAGPDHAQIAAAQGIADYFDALDAHHGGTDDGGRADRVRTLLREAEKPGLQRLLDWLARRDDVRLLGERIRLNC